MLTKAWSAALNGITPFTVEIEVSSNGKGNENVVHVVGLPDATVRESKDRIRSAIFSSGLQYPEGFSTVSLAPAEIKKSGAALDLPIALGLLSTSNDLDPNALQNTLLIGELALDGRLRPVRGALAMAIHARENGFTRMLVPADNAAEASVAEGVQIYAVHSLKHAYDLLAGNELAMPVSCDIDTLFNSMDYFENDFSHVKGQYAVKRGMEIAAAGSHNLLKIGKNILY